MEVNHSQILGIYILVNTRYAKKKKKTNWFFDKNDDPNRNRRFVWDRNTVLFGIRGIDFNLVFTSYKSSLFSGGLGVRAL